MQSPINRRQSIAALALSAVGLVTIAIHEGYRNRAYKDTVGVSTIGFGTTKGVKMGDKITPPKALQRTLSDIQKYEGAVKKCVKVPLYQYEYDAYMDFAYNIGTTKFCSSTLVKKLNKEDYYGACKEILRWVKQPELKQRRQDEYRMCIGDSK